MECVCIASGPSLNICDVQRVREWRDADETRRVYVVNNSWRIAPWADVLFAMDGKWLRQYARDIPFKGEVVSSSTHARSHSKVTHIYSCAQNSGMGAVLLAQERGATYIVLTGYDMQPGPDGALHWHEEYPEHMAGGKTMEKWAGQFEHAQEKFHARVVNATRRTALRCFPQMTLEDALQ